MNYSDIVSIALSYADREDSEVKNRMDQFMRIVEARTNRFLKVRQMSVRTRITTALTQEYYGLPSDFAGLRDIEILDSLTEKSRKTLAYLSPEQMNDKVSLLSDQGIITPLLDKAIYYTIIADQIQIYPDQDGEILELVYYQSLPTLTANTPNNWLADIAPDAYIFGLLTEINAFVKDAETASLWEGRFSDVLNGLSINDDMERWSGTALQIRLG